jgi:hypothetical protein
VAVGDDGSITVIGTFSGTATFGVGASVAIQRTASTNQEFFIAQFDSSGEPDWVVQANAAVMGGPAYVVRFSDGSALVSASFVSKPIFSPADEEQTTIETERIYTYGTYNVFLAAIAADGTVLWVKYLDGIDEFEFRAMSASLDDSGVFITSSLYSNQTFGVGEPNETTLSCDSVDCALVAKYDRDGSLVWAKSTLMKNGGGISDITCLSDSSFVVTGGFGGETTFGPGQSTETSFTSDGEGDIFLARYDGDGKLIWASRAGGCNPFVEQVLVNGEYLFQDQDHEETVPEYGQAVTTSPNGTIYMTGFATGEAVFAEGTDLESTYSTKGKSDIFIASFEP